MDIEKLEIMKNGNGFIAALDQSGGSSAKTLALYGIDNTMYKDESEMFDMIHDMRSRIIQSYEFKSDDILGVILFEETMNRQINGIDTSSYLWNEKHILSFLKIDKGLMELEDGVQLMKEIPNIEETLKVAVNKGIFGTKMRSVIKEANQTAIEKVVKQQFEIASIIAGFNLVPIIEPEVDINAPDKKLCEEMLKLEVKKYLEKYNNIKVIFKFSIPTVANFYEELLSNPNVVRIVALSGGYPRREANALLKKNRGIIASFSRALLEGLNINQSEIEFDLVLRNNILSIYDASVYKEEN